MPRGIYVHKPFTEEHKRNLSIAHIGQKSYWKNKKLSKKHIKNLSLAHKGKKQSEETKRKMSLAHKGKRLSKKHKAKLSLARLGNKNPMWHKNLSEEHKKKISLANSNEKCWKWKGDKAGYWALHTWIRKNKPKSKLCEFCGKEKDRFGHTKLDIANINNHIYTRNLDDYKWGHRSCHKKFDLKE